MRTRAKALTVAVAMVTTFAILPALGAAAAEPLEDGSYDVAVGESTYTVAVVEGLPVVDEAEGVAFAFAYDEETGRVLDEFDVSVDGVAYDVLVADDGTVTVVPAEGDGSTGDGTDVTDGTEETDDTEGTEGTDGAEELEEDGTDELEEDDELDEDDDAAHGALVSTVAQCAPNGRDAREAGLPNHGFFVRAAAHGEDVEFEVDGETHVAALSTQEGADAFCALAEGLTADTPDEVVDDEPTDDVTDEQPTAETAEAREDDAADRDDAKDRGKGKDRGDTKDRGKDRGDAKDRGKGRAGAPGQQGRND